MPNALPRIALFAGDPAGIGPEITARLLADPASTAQAHITLLADEAVLQRAQRACGLPPGLPAGVQLMAQPLHEPVPLSQPSREAGRHVLQCLQTALDLHASGQAQAIVFAPLNKGSLHAAGMGTEDELRWFAQRLSHSGPTSEFNTLDGVWTSRVTSHIALAEVPRAITHQGIVQAIALLHEAIAASGVAQPRLAVCGLNPHNGDNGNFGREEIELIEPAVRAAAAQGLKADGPFAADTIFLKVAGEQKAYDGIVTMYHDQGQIAMKLMGFSRGVTVQGGLSVPICTPAHGTAFDIAGRGLANHGALAQAFALACRMARGAASSH